MSLYRERFNAILEFFKMPFRDLNDDRYLQNELSMSDDFLKVKILIDKKMHTITHSENHNIEDGKMRINVLMWNELLDKDKNKKILISTDRLDGKLYSEQFIGGLIELDSTSEIKILYKRSSSNVNKLIEVLGEAKVKHLKIANSDLPNFIIGNTSSSFEKKQTYDENDILIGHEADFYYNIENVNVSKVGNIAEKIEALKQSFISNW